MAHKPAHSVMPRLPPEIWAIVLRFATQRADVYTVTYQPFLPSFLTTNSSKSDSGLDIKSTIALVCKTWRALGMELLYEHIFIGRAVAALQRTLEGGPDLPSPGRWVRRAHLPYAFSETPRPTSHPIPAISILNHCPSLQILVRPPPVLRTLNAPLFEFPINTPSFPSLKRIDWWHHNLASRTGGINSLNDVLPLAPNLEYLSLAGDMWPNSLRRTPLTLSHLKVLRVRGINAMFVRQVSMWSLPALTHFVVDSMPHPYAFATMWECLGEQALCVEIGCHMHFLLDDFLTTVLEGCPNMQELNYHVFFTAAPRFSGTHRSLKRIQMHAFPNHSVVNEDDDTWEYVKFHALTYDKDKFPALAEIVLFGSEWRRLVELPMFNPIKDAIEERGLTLTTRFSY